MTYKELQDALNYVSEERLKLLNEVELLTEELKTLKSSILKLYSDMISLDTINQYENEKIEEL